MVHNDGTRSSEERRSSRDFRGRSWIGLIQTRRAEKPRSRVETTCLRTDYLSVSKYGGTNSLSPYRDGRTVSLRRLLNPSNDRTRWHTKRERSFAYAARPEAYCASGLWIIILYSFWETRLGNFLPRDTKCQKVVTRGALRTMGRCALFARVYSLNGIHSRILKFRLGSHPPGRDSPNDEVRSLLNWIIYFLFLILSFGSRRAERDKTELRSRNWLFRSKILFKEFASLFPARYGGIGVLANWISQA